MDKISSCKEEGVFQYLQPHEVPTREQELDHHKRDASLHVDKQGLLRTIEGAKMPSANVASDLRLRQAFSRRGVAYELVMSLPSPPTSSLWKGCSKTTSKSNAWLGPLTLQQLLAADKKAFKMLQDRMPLGPSRDATGKRSADAILDAISLDPIFLQLLTPLPITTNAKSATQDDDGRSKRKLERENEELRGQLKRARVGGSAQSAKGKSKGAKGRSSPSMPAALHGLHPTNKSGQRLCYAFKLSQGCSVSGGDCPKGKHECTKCHSANHGASNCPK